MQATALTRRGWSMLGAGMGLLVAGRLLGTPELTTLGVSALALIAGALLWTRSRRIPLVLARTVRPQRIHVGGEARVDLEITAHAPSPQVTLTDAFDDGRRAARLLVPALDRAQRCRAAYRIPTDRRGRFTVGPAVVGVGDPFGLTERGVPLGATDEVIVRPRVHELRPAVGAPGPRRARANRHAVLPLAALAHDEFLALRDYAIGDDPRRVHWRSSARLGDLMVREDESAREPRTVLVFDNRDGSHRGQSYEAAVEAVASIGLRMLHTGRSCEIVTTTGRILGARHQGVSTEARLLDELAMISPEPDAPIARAIMARTAPERRALVVVVTGVPEDLSAYAALTLPQAPVTVVVCGEGSPSMSFGMNLVDGRPGALVESWNASIVRAKRRRRRGGPE